MSRSVLVTGAASGNGRAIAARFLASGERVTAVDVSGDALHALRDGEWAAHGDRLACVTADVAHEAGIETAVAQAIGAFGGVDVLVNNAGITGGPQATVLHETPIAIFDSVFAVNVRAIFLGCRAVIPKMLARGGGVIVNIASIAGLAAFPARAAYTASKGAVIALTRSITADYAGSGIRANALCPGMIETPMTQWRLDQPELRRAVEARIPQGRIGSVADVASAVWFLASSEAEYFNGSAVVMDGGYMAV